MQRDRNDELVEIEWDEGVRPPFRKVAMLAFVSTNILTRDARVPSSLHVAASPVFVEEDY